MKIVDVELYPIKATPDEFAPGTKADSVIIRILTDSSVAGFGEATVTQRGDFGSASSLIGRLKRYSAALIGADALNLNGISLRLDDVEGNVQSGSRAARTAVDMAMYDIVGKVREVPVCTVLGGAFRTEMDLQITLPEGSPEENALRARRFSDGGVRGVKVPIGRRVGFTDRNGEPEKRQILAVLQAVPPDVQVDVAANQSWSNADLARSFFASLLEEVFPGNLSLEQPLHRLDLMGHSELRETLPIPIILSESVVSAETMMQSVRSAAADRVVIHADRVGGLTAARQIADICEAASIGVSFDSAAGTKLSATAHAHLASTVRDPLPLDLGSHVFHQESPISGGFDLIGGRIVLQDLPGLGVELDEDALKALSIEA